MAKFNCTECHRYDKLNCYYCRKCGGSVQVGHISRQKLAQTYTTDEKYCDNCGKLRHNGSNCTAKIKFTS